MNVLFIGGTGLISSACTRLAIERGLDVTLLNRGHGPDRAQGATRLVADLHDEAAAARALAGRQFDVVVDWIAFTPEDVERDLRSSAIAPTSSSSSAPRAPTRNPSATG